MIAIRYRALYRVHDTSDKDGAIPIQLADPDHDSHFSQKFIKYSLFFLQHL